MVPPFVDKNYPFLLIAESLETEYYRAKRGRIVERYEVIQKRVESAIPLNSF